MSRNRSYEPTPNKYVSNFQTPSLNIFKQQRSKSSITFNQNEIENMQQNCETFQDKMKRVQKIIKKH